MVGFCPSNGPNTASPTPVETPNSRCGVTCPSLLMITPRAYFNCGSTAAVEVMPLVPVQLVLGRFWPDFTWLVTVLSDVAPAPELAFFTIMSLPLRSSNDHVIAVEVQQSLPGIGCSAQAQSAGDQHRSLGVVGGDRWGTWISHDNLAACGQGYPSQSAGEDAGTWVHGKVGGAVGGQDSS